MAPDRDLIVARLRAAGCVWAEDEADLLISAGDPALVDRRVNGEPLEYLLGWAEFAGRRWTVTPGVFVPRHRTEYLVSVAKALCPPSPVVLDLCCGCGALAGALAASITVGEIHAVDVDPAAVACAAVNLPGAQVGCGDLFDPLPAALRRRVDVLLANVPYVPTAEIELLPVEARTYEVRAALDGGPDGLGVLRRVLAEAPAWLAPGGVLLSEVGEAQEPAALSTAAQAGLAARIERDDDTSVLVAHRRVTKSVGQHADFGSTRRGSFRPSGSAPG